MPNREAMPPLHFCAHSFFHAQQLQFCSVYLLHSRELLLQSFHPYPSHDSVPLLLYTAVFFRPPELYNCTLPVNYHAHQKQCSPVDIQTHHYCSPTRVRLATHMHRRQTNTNSMHTGN